MSEFEKELAVLKGRVDGLEAWKGEFESQMYRLEKSGVLIMDTYDVNTGEIKKSTKVIKATRYGKWRRGLSDNSAVFVGVRSSILFSNSNETGNWPLLKFYNTEDTDLTGKDLVIGRGSYDEKNWRNIGVIPSPQGSWFIVNKQNLV